MSDAPVVLGGPGSVKVFISHSTSDGWVARQIAKHLEELGAQTFLDAKDLETGDSIDDSIHAQLSNCDELLLLVSPAALTSTWVLLEVGGARALGKRLVPVLFHVLPNELPQPISRHLARDINEIDVYYAELRGRMEGRLPSTAPPAVEPRRAAARRPRSRPLKVGDLVQITSRVPTDRPARESPGWADEMEDYLGDEGVVTQVDASDGTVRLDVDDRSFWWSPTWLKAVESEDPD